MGLTGEFDRQVENYVRGGFSEVVGLQAADLSRRLEPLRERVAELRALDESDGRLPFVVVLQHESLSAERAMPLIDLKGRPGFTSMAADDLAGFQAIDGVAAPGGLAYLLVDVDTGRATLNLTPHDGLNVVRAENRSPLTLNEGIALVTHYPEALKRRNCFYMLGSRRADRRVTALWVSKGRPRLGWCWEGNPHTWLGSASCGSRVGPAA